MRGRADSGDVEIDLVELFTDLGGLAADRGLGIAVFIDEMQDLGPDDVSALCAACHEISQSGLPLIVVGAGLPHLPAVLSAAKSYSERLFGYQRIDRLDREAADLALRVPAEAEDAAYDDAALDALYAATGGYPYFIQAYGKTVWDLAPRSPITVDDVTVAAPEAERELAVGFFGSRFERATPGEREYLRAMADAASALADGRGAARRGRVGADRRGGRGPRQEAAVALTRPRRAAEEGPDLLRRARPDRLHGPPLRRVPPLPLTATGPGGPSVAGRVDGNRRPSAPHRPISSKIATNSAETRTGGRGAVTVVTSGALLLRGAADGVV